MQIINLLVSSILQIILFSIIPFIWWLIYGRNECEFFKWLGINKPILINKTKYIISFILVIIFSSMIAIFIVPKFVDKSTMATAQFLGKGGSSLIPALIYSFLQTAFSEEIFFRGFLTKRLIYKFGFKVGNVVQGGIFGTLHGILFISKMGLFSTIIIILFTGALGWLMGWINEKQSNGSIISSWLLHGCFNTISSIISILDL
jgi:CAAX amino terminal protease family.